MNLFDVETTKLLMKYLTARIDIKNFGNANNDIKIARINDLSANLSHPNWFKNNEGMGIIIESSLGFLNFELKCVNDGILRIWLRGIDCLDRNNNRFPVYVDYVNFEVNGEKIINGNTLTCHDEPYFYEKKVQNGEIIRLLIKWKPFNNFSQYDDKLRDTRKKLSDLENKVRSIPQLSCTSFGSSALNGRLIYRNWRSSFSTRTLMDDFDGFCEREWFTRYIKHKFSNEDFKINLIGPFERHYTLNWPMDGKKVFYSPENLNRFFPEMDQKFDRYALDYVDFSMGFDFIVNPKYLRFPNWLWWHFPPEVSDEEIEKTVDLWNSLNYDKSFDVVNVSSHDNWNSRTIIADSISKYVHITYGGKWRNNTRDLWDIYKNNKKAFIKNFKFYLCPENTMADGYVTEKIFDGIRCGCIPLYAGGGNYLEPEVLNHNAILRWFIDENQDNSDVVEQFKNIISDEKSYNEFKDQDILLNSSKKYIINKFHELERHFERLIYD